MKIRALKTNDLFSLSKILKKMGMKIDPTDKTQEQLGGEIILGMFENIHMAQSETNEWLGSLVEMNGEEFGELPIEQSFEVISEIKNIPGIASFFKEAGLLTTKK